MTNRSEFCLPVLDHEQLIAFNRAVAADPDPDSLATRLAAALRLEHDLNGGKLDEVAIWAALYSVIGDDGHLH